MINPISGGTAFDYGTAAQTVAAQPQTTTAPRPSIEQPAKTVDTVKLSDGAQVRLLRTQGQTVGEIIVSTALSAETVDSYLGITPAPPPPVAQTQK